MSSTTNHMPCTSELIRLLEEQRRDLLAACKAAQKALNNGMVYGDQDDIGAARRCLAAAIARAEGMGRRVVVVPPPAFAFKDEGGYTIRFEDGSFEETPVQSLRHLREVAGTFGMVLVRQKGGYGFKPRSRRSNDTARASETRAVVDGDEPPGD